MAKGDSGRIVIEVSPDLKRKLYSALAIESQTLKDWFISAAGQFLAEKEETAKSTKKSKTPRDAQ